ncbi:MAG: hypothetical protein KGJ78_00015 [Alphaproteobacteria bacterium]|nr:hypothetical protein [Alphaproteobacteria bacterium]
MKVFTGIVMGRAYGIAAGSSIRETIRIVDLAGQGLPLLRRAVHDAPDPVAHDAAIADHGDAHDVDDGGARHGRDDGVDQGDRGAGAALEVVHPALVIDQFGGRIARSVAIAARRAGAFAIASPVRRSKIIVRFGSGRAPLPFRSADVRSRRTPRQSSRAHRQCLARGKAESEADWRSIGHQSPPPRRQPDDPAANAVLHVGM